MNDAPIYDYQELVIEEMRKELINQDQYIGKLTEAYNIEIERLNNIINELEKELDLNLPFKVVGVRHLKNKLQELKGSNNGVWVNNLLEVIKENDIEFGSDK